MLDGLDAGCWIGWMLDKFLFKMFNMSNAFNGFKPTEPTKPSKLVEPTKLIEHIEPLKPQIPKGDDLAFKHFNYMMFFTSPGNAL